MFTPPIEIVAVIFSLSANLVVVLLEPEFIYLTNNVLGSVPSVTTVFTTVAWTPEVAPVNTPPCKFERVEVPEKEVSFTASYSRLLELGKWVLID